MTLSNYVWNLPSEGHKKAKARMAKKMERKYITKSVPKDGKYDPSKWELKTTSFGNGRGGTDTDSFLVKRQK